jgi:hypothetical protein
MVLDPVQCSKTTISKNGVEIAITKPIYQREKLELL